MLALSHFVIQWNWAEHNFNVLGNQSRSDALLALARKNEKNGKILELTEFAAKAFGIIKTNRNSLVHSHSISHDSEAEEAGEKPKWIRGSKNPKNQHVYCHADIDDISDNLEAACRLALLLTQLNIYYMSPEHVEPSLGKFELPKTLTPIPIPIPEPIDPPPPSPA